MNTRKNVARMLFFVGAAMMGTAVVQFMRPDPIPLNVYTPEMDQVESPVYRPAPPHRRTGGR